MRRASFDVDSVFSELYGDVSPLRERNVLHDRQIREAQRSFDADHSRDAEIDAICQNLHAQSAAIEWARREWSREEIDRAQRLELRSRMEAQHRRLQKEEPGRFAMPGGSPQEKEELGRFGMPGSSRKENSPTSREQQQQLQQQQQALLRMIAQRDAEIDALKHEREEARSECQAALMERDVALDALEEERSDHNATELLLSDAAEYVRHLKQSCMSMEATIRCLQRQARDSARQQQQQQETSASSPTASPEQPLFGLSNTRNAIVEAVKEAASLPTEERNKKIRSLRAKWHPDKHDVLKDMASEVLKMINEAVDKHFVD